MQDGRMTSRLAGHLTSKPLHLIKSPCLYHPSTRSPAESTIQSPSHPTLHKERLATIDPRILLARRTEEQSSIVGRFTLKSGRHQHQYQLDCCQQNKSVVCFVYSFWKSLYTPYSAPFFQSTLINTLRVFPTTTHLIALRLYSHFTLPYSRTMGRPAKRMKREEPTPRCFFLEIPIEIRLLIFDFALAETNNITISVAELEKNIFASSGPDETIEGIPGKYVPLIKNELDAKMMEIGKVEVISRPGLLDGKGPTASMDSGYGSFETSSAVAGGKFGRPNHRPEIPLLTSMSLFLTNRQIHDEMTAHIIHPTSARSTLNVNYPYGIIVLETLYPCLLRYAEKICISGWYDGQIEGTPFDQPTSTRERYRLPLSDTPKEVYDIANSALARLMHTTMGPIQHPTLKSISFRVFYPKEEQYSIIWSCNDSPVVVGLRNTCGGKIDMKVLRGNSGNGVVMNITPRSKNRHLTTTWRKFQGSRIKELGAWRNFGNSTMWNKDAPEGECWSA
jgi:hypothetical protein